MSKSYRDRVYLAGPIIAGALYFVIGFLLLKTVPHIDVLYDSGETPWGFITSILVYDGSGNVEWYIIFLGAFYAEMLACGSRIKIKRSIFVTWAIFAMGILANLVWLVVFGIEHFSQHTYGQSGVIYSFLGFTFLFSLYDLLFITEARMKKKPSAKAKYFVSSMSKSKLKKGATVTVALVVVTLTFYLVFLMPGAFLSYAPGVNTFVHFVGFLGAFILGALVLNSRRGATYLLS